MKIYKLEDESISPQPTGGKAKKTDEFFEESFLHYLKETGRQLPEALKGTRFRKLTGRGEHGKPYIKIDGFEGIHFSLSHTTGFAAIAFAESPVGLDLVNTNISMTGDPERLSKIAKRYFTDSELGYIERSGGASAAFVTVWACREAWGKYTGEGLRSDFEKTDVIVLMGTESGAAIATGILGEKKNIVCALCADVALLKEIVW
ncbi:MAG: 4'-phosphopantetheinyl transferase superfamily protein [Clostridiales Family XIII bacterium]|jgi:phosphopantetheinyl transferase|nr:4'-phosphopantetheinyl transferase superfamily protein [Clostridiales Family XIII bacterium]